MREGSEIRARVHDLTLEALRRLAATMTAFAQRVSAASLEVTLAGLEAATEFGARFAQVASGVLAGIADALAERGPGSKDDHG